MPAEVAHVARVAGISGGATNQGSHPATPPAGAKKGFSAVLPAWPQTTVVRCFELLSGVGKRGNAIRGMLSSLTVLPLDGEAAARVAEVAGLGCRPRLRPPLAHG